MVVSFKNYPRRLDLVTVTMKIMTNRLKDCKVFKRFFPIKRDVLAFFKNLFYSKTFAPNVCPHGYYAYNYKQNRNGSNSILLLRKWVYQPALRKFSVKSVQ